MHRQLFLQHSILHNPVRISKSLSTPLTDYSFGTAHPSMVITSNDPQLAPRRPAYAIKTGRLGVAVHPSVSDTTYSGGVSISVPSGQSSLNEQQRGGLALPIIMPQQPQRRPAKAAETGLSSADLASASLEMLPERHTDGGPLVRSNSGRLPPAYGEQRL